MEKLTSLFCMLLILIACGKSTGVVTATQGDPQLKKDASEKTNLPNYSEDMAKANGIENLITVQLDRHLPDSVQVWSGTEYLVWGANPYQEGASEVRSGFKYNPKSKSMVPMSLVNAPSLRIDANGFWTGSKLLVWGGQVPNTKQAPILDGGLYDSVQDQWESVPAIPEGFKFSPFIVSDLLSSYHDQQLVVFSFQHISDDTKNAGAIYHLDTKSWTEIQMDGVPYFDTFTSAKVLWSGTQILIFGTAFKKTPAGTQEEKMVVAIYDTAKADLGWKVIGSPDAPLKRKYFSVVETKNGIFVWGGTEERGENAFNDGGIFNLDTQSWSTIAANPNISGKDHAALFVKDNAVVIWGGFVGHSDPTQKNSGAIYHLDTQTWSILNPKLESGAGDYITDIWADGQIFIFRGRSFNLYQIPAEKLAH